MCLALMQILTLYPDYCIFIGDFNVNWLIQKDKTPLHNLFVRDHNYRQLISCYTTDNRTTIDHIYTNLPESEVCNLQGENDEPKIQVNYSNKMRDLKNELDETCRQ